MKHIIDRFRYPSLHARTGKAARSGEAEADGRNDGEVDSDGTVITVLSP